MGKTKIPLPEINANTSKYTGTFSHVPALCITEPFSDKVSVPQSCKGKQFRGGLWHGADSFAHVASDAFRKASNATTALFTVAPSLSSSADVKGKDKYVDNDRYKEKFPDGDFRPKACSKLGFMTSDFAKRELYANTRNTERLRETLRKEDRLMKKVRQDMEARNSSNDSLSAEGGAPEELPQQKLYDVVHRNPATSLKYKRDDRQGIHLYIAQRKSMRGEMKFCSVLSKGADVEVQMQEEGYGSTLKSPTGSKWVQVKLPSGPLLNVLVDDNQKIVAQRVVDEVTTI
ncbi:hypothetical protein GUITHDRAFT_108156 [Guillardia theta CCMP2712]|uniref:Uncharacterized protein n=1 Tax=Guillardia theta (strain CCMP2712) TaxID=905079 RepID=L1JCS6_GUITC|nr:hypothetical protein GUITHDRAFT_108156 [Guillardia theta CCMP2712]EKX46122.1 hypothetical protein GUITHDRAFT_108156 [Guillardia theta CCMP2712]|eukprot:XP_005833102.1 hypothetical protein GUITHDRAFT_108156 [Guillardia theta CCMP2712]